MLVSANGLEKHYGTFVCFEDAEFVLMPGARVGLIGANGTGKTSLMRILLGETDYGGNVARKKDLRIASLEQDPKFADGATVRESALDPEMADLERRAHDGDMNAISEFEHRGGYTLDHRAERILEGIGIPRARHGDPIASLSGGERNRVAFARLLLTEPDLWLLDEPTNHLDLDGILFLEEALRESRIAAVVISHDRRFLDRVTTETWELEGKRLFRYPAPYSRAKELRAERIKSEHRAYQRQQADIQKQEEFIRRYQAGQRARQAKGRKTLLARLERLQRPEDRARMMALNLPPGEPMGVRALGVRELSLRYDRPLFQDLAIDLDSGETLGIVGPNGAGKTSLLRILLGQQAPGTGQVRWAPRAKPGILTQHESFPDETLTPYAYIRAVEAKRSDQELRDTLAAMLFQGDDVEKPVSVLSGGERKRLMLTRLLLEGNNVLILDEPTNHLDVPSREALEFALGAYEGTVIVVSHDRYFLDQVADRILWIENGEWRLTEGGFQDALDRRRTSELRKTEPRRTGVAPHPPRGEGGSPRPPRRRGPFSWMPTAELEAKIMACEARIRDLEVRFSAPDIFTNPGRMREIQSQIVAAKAELAALDSEYTSR